MACIIARRAGLLAATTAVALVFTARGAHAQQTQQLPTIVVQPSAEPAPSDAEGGGTTGGAEQLPDQSAWGPIDGYSAANTATGIKTDTPLKEIPQSISVIGAEQMRDQGANTLQEAVRYTAGVVADGYGIDSRTDSIFVRGTEATEYLDGLRRTFNYYVYNYRIDPYFLERVEVLRGPASVLYGQGAVGGIINSVSKRPLLEHSSEVTAEYGNFDFKQVKFDSTGPITPDGVWSYRITGLARDADTQVNYVDDDRLAIQPAITWRPQAGTSVTLMGHFQKDRTGSVQQFFPHLGTIEASNSGFIPWDAFVGEPDDKYNTDVASGTLNVEHKLNEMFTFRQNMRYADIHNDYDSTYSGFFWTGVPYINAAESEMYRMRWISGADTQVFNSDTNLEAKFETGALSHKVLVGYDYADFQAETVNGYALNMTPFNVYDPVYGEPQTLVTVPCVPVAKYVDGIPVCHQPDQQVKQGGVYIQDQMRLGNWIAVVGARHDRVQNATEGAPTQTDEANSYRAGLMYEFAFGLTPYVSYTESFVPVVGTTFGGAAFDPQQGEMREVGFKYQRPGSNFAINGAVYDLVESNRLAGDAANPGFSVQTGEVSIWGYEIEGVGNVTDTLKVIASYSYTDAKYTGGDQEGFRVESVPEHLASLWAIKEFALFGHQGFSIGGGVRYVGSSWDGTDTLETPSHTLFDAMAAYETDNWRFAVNVYNLEDEEYLVTCLARGDCFRGESRTILSSLTRKF